MKTSRTKLKKIAIINGKIYNPLKNKLISGNIIIEDGLLKDLNYTGNLEDFEVIDCKGKIISPGFLDLRAHFGEPMEEDVETFESGASAALAGGFTKVCISPNNHSMLDTPEVIDSINKKSKDLDINVFPIGCVSRKMEGKELSEIGLMVDNGAVAISDGKHSIQNAQLMKNALEYAKMFDIPVINFAKDKSLSSEGIANESFFSTKMGLPASPSISESIIIYRDLEIAAFVNGKIHIPLVSTEKSVNLIKRYKDKGIKVTADVSAHHLGLNEKSLNEFDSAYKFDPPLRSDSDIKALIEGLKDGAIDCVVSDHSPHRLEEKEADLLNAQSDSIGLESVFAYSNQVLSSHGFDIKDILRLFTVNPKSVINLDWEPLKINEGVDLVIIDPDVEWKFDAKNIFSKSKNSAFLGQNMRGKVEMILHKNKFFKIS